VSIYASIFGFDEDCGNSPILYRGSHILPADNNKRGGHFGIAAIPGHIYQGSRKAISDDMQPYWPWLRVSLNETVNDCHDVILTRRQVAELRDALNEWLVLAPDRSR
jgi:hypothetical protein